MKTVIIYLCALLALKTDAARILTWVPTASVSHQVIFRPLTQALVKRGHEVVIITADPAFKKGEAPANLTEIDLHDVSYAATEMFKYAPKGSKEAWNDGFSFAYSLFYDTVDKQLGTPELKELLKSKQTFDLLIIEAATKSALVLSHVFKAPVIMVSSLGAIFESADIIGAPTHPILYPHPLRQKLNNLSLWDKFSEVYNTFKMMNIIHSHEEKENKMLQKHFGTDVPSISELKNNVDMLFLNIHPIFEGNHPVPPSVVYIWGIHSTLEKELPKDLKTYLDSSKNGVIYISFGTNTDPTLLPPEKVQTFVRVLCQLPYNVLFKWGNDKLPEGCDKIKIGKWFPQSDLLRHPNVKLFITQGGLQSVDEAIKAGVPLVGIPMMGDQWYNVEKFEHFKIGKQLELQTFTEEQLKDAITTVIEDESYRRNIKQLDVLMRDQPTQPLERAVWWTEHVLRHGGARHLRAPAANISWTQYFEIQLVLTLLLGLLVVTLAGIVLLYSIYRFFVRTFCSSGKLKSS